MLTRKFHQAALLVGLSALALPFTAGCSGGQAEVKSADNLPAGAMPANGEWQGVYYNQTFGFLHVTTSGNALQGAWKTTAGDKWGELFGEIEGDLVRFTWIERTIGVVGPSAKSEGKGYFRYTIPKAEEAHELKGEWGLGENAMGHSWDCVKQTNMEPDPKSVRPDEMESRVGASGFDGAKGDSDIGKEEESEDDEGKDAPAGKGASGDDPL